MKRYLFAFLITLCFMFSQPLSSDKGTASPENSLYSINAVIRSEFPAPVKAIDLKLHIYPNLSCDLKMNIPVYSDVDPEFLIEPIGKYPNPA